VKVFGNDKPWFTKNLNIKLKQKEEAFKSGDRALYKKSQVRCRKSDTGSENRVQAQSRRPVPLKRYPLCLARTPVHYWLQAKAFNPWL
jgi:hypothetical protein